MKKIFITFMVAVSLLTFNRCTSLDMEPVSSISDANYWKSSDQFKAFNTGLHSLLRLRSYNIFVLGEPRADIYGVVAKWVEVQEIILPPRLLCKIFNKTAT